MCLSVSRRRKKKKKVTVAPCLHKPCSFDTDAALHLYDVDTLLLLNFMTALRNCHVMIIPMTSCGRHLYNFLPKAPVSHAIVIITSFVLTIYMYICLNNSKLHFFLTFLSPWLAYRGIGSPQYVITYSSSLIRKKKKKELCRHAPDPLGAKFDHVHMKSFTLRATVSGSVTCPLFSLSSTT